jgi:hypothetical protein
MLHFFLSGVFSPLFPLTCPGKELRLAIANNQELRYLDELSCQLDRNQCNGVTHLNGSNQFRHHGDTPVPSFHQSLSDLALTRIPG